MGHLAELASIALAQWRIKEVIRTGPSSYPFIVRDQAPEGLLPRVCVPGALAQLGERLNRIQ